jgi:hypothetical protein
MATQKRGTEGSEQPQEAWTRWEQAHADVLERATVPQRVLLEAAVRFVAAIVAQPIMTRMAAFFLLHAGMGLTPAQVGRALGRTDRAMRYVQALSAQDLLESIWGELRRHRQPKLHAEHAGPIAKYLVDHPRCMQAEVVAFIARELSIDIDPQTLRRFFKTYGLGVLCAAAGDADATEDARPFALGAPASEEPSSCCPSRSR